MKNYKYFLENCMLFCIFAISFLSQAQEPTVGLQFYNENTYEGYTLFSPESNNSVYLINNCGEKINEWTFTEQPGATCYLLENGNLLRAGKQSIEIRDWDNNVVWTFLMSSIGMNQHHDIEPLPNGNILCVITDIYTDTEMIAEGRDPSILDTTFKLDKIVELQPVGTFAANVVWEWKFIDHFVQEFDNTKANYGNVIDHPELIDLNFNNGNNFDYTHVNGIDYNANLDQIIISPRHLNEILIIDHSTTTAEAAGHTGGNSNMGGDILWRWGNPQVYKQGVSADQKLFLQHDSKWVETGYLDEGKITVFNNGGSGTGLSSVHLITPEIVNGVYTKENNKFKPLDFEWSWSGSLLGDNVSESKKSGTHSLPNGNFIICETGRGRVSEITKSGVHLWSYKNPSGDLIINQFEIPIANTIFRAEKYPDDYIGFDGLDLTPQGIIENENSISDACTALLGFDDYSIEKFAVVNPVESNLIQFSKSINANKISIFDINGRLIYNQNNFKGHNLKVDLPNSLYVIKFYFNKETITKKIIVN